MYSKPRILLVDCTKKSADRLRERGFNVSEGTLGGVAAVEQNYEHVVIKDTSRLAGLADQDILFVDLAVDGIDRGISLEAPDDCPRELWCSCEFGVVDTRLRAMHDHRSCIDRIYQNRGAIVVFTDREHSQRIVISAARRGRMDRAKELSIGKYHFLSVLDQIDFVNDEGSESHATELLKTHSGKFASFVENLPFRCTIKPNLYMDRRVVPIATSKYGLTVAAMVLPSDKTSEGMIYLLPRPKNIEDFIYWFVTEYLQDDLPELFPENSRFSWRDNALYVPPQVEILINRLSEHKANALSQQSILENEIASKKAENSYYSGIMSETGDVLVGEIKRALSVMGFTEIVDVDELISKGIESGPKKEDLRLVIGDRTVLLECKGITGIPSEAESLQVSKYVSARSREWCQTNLAGLSIINHQRYLAPLERDNKGTFTRVALSSAADYCIGLLTTVDLSKLLRGCLKYGWRIDSIAPLFLEIGRISPIPTNYRPIGAIGHFYEMPGALKMLLENQSLSVGDRIAYETQLEYIEENIESIRIEDAVIDKVSPGVEISVKTILNRSQAAIGTRVFKVV